MIMRSPQKRRFGRSLGVGGVALVVGWSAFALTGSAVGSLDDPQPKQVEEADDNAWVEQEVRRHVDADAMPHKVIRRHRAKFAQV